MCEKSLIPKGPYCYIGKGWSEGSYKILLCPYWSKRYDKPEQMNGYCSFLKKGDWEFEHFGLLWDQCKECGIDDD